MRRAVLILALVLSLPAFGAAAAEPAAQREFVPVQEGFAASGGQEPAWAPDRLLVKFTAEALRRSRLDLPLEKGAAAPDARTGLASVDAVLQDAAVGRIARAHGKLRNEAEAARLGVDRWFELQVPAGTDIPGLARRLGADPNLEYALPDYRAFPAAVPNDPLYPDNWGHNNTAQLPDYGWGTTWDHTGPGVGTVGFDANAQTAWDGLQGYGNSGVVIAIIDSGVDVDHPDLSLVTGYDFGSGDTNPDDNATGAGHGTCCAGVAAAVIDNSLGAAGIAGSCSIMPLKVANNAGSIYFSSITNALYYAADNGADIASMSLGAAITSYPSTDAALQYAFNAGVVLLAATGNENNSTISYPAISPYVIGVGAASPCGERKRSSSDTAELNPGVLADPNDYTCDGERWWGSNYGSTVQDNAGAVDVLAPTILPTTDIVGAGGYRSDDYEPFFNGTSCSTPYAAGVCGLIRALNPGWTATQVRDRLVDTAQDILSVESAAGWDRYAGYGMVDAAAAVAGAPTPPVAAFGVDTAAGCEPLSVTFDDQSTGTITSWDWAFGDGGTSAVQNPGHTYTNAGSYAVTLIVAGPAGADTLTIADMVAVGEAPTADFSAAPLSGTAPLEVTFTDLSTGGPTAWTYYLGDTSQSTEQNPVHTYTDPGVYTIVLVAENSCGQGIANKIEYITVTAPAPPVAAFSASPLAGCAPLEVAFTDESTGDVSGWTWHFGDGDSSTVQNPVHSYAAPGSYAVSLTVTGPGGSDTLADGATVSAGGPPAAAFAASDSSGTAPFAVDFSDLSTGGVAGRLWDFGDAATDTAQNPSHVYAAAGTYTVTLVVFNDCGADTLTASDLIAVAAPAAPVAAFSALPTSGCAPLNVQFTDASSGDITSWAWDFGDAGTDTVQNPAHLYAAPGTFDVRLIVFGPGGADTLAVPGMIAAQGPVTAAFGVSVAEGANPLMVEFADQSTGGPTFWAWDFGDGATDTLQNPTHTYTLEGTYTVTLTAGNACGTDQVVQTDLIIVHTAARVGEGAPAVFALGRNYPNPFNPITTITFSLSRPGHALLEIFDASGRRVDVLVDGQQAAGEHRVTWQPNSLASGVYFARFLAEGRTATSRLVLVR